MRTLAKLEAFGLVKMEHVGRRLVPRVVVGMVRMEIDPFAMADRVEVGLVG